MGKKTPPPKPPDLSPITDAQLEIARESNELAREYLGLSREQYAYFQENAQEELALAREQADRLFEFQNKAFESDEEMKEFARQVGEQQMEAMNLQMDYARRDRERYEQVFLPMQDRMIEEAEAYDTPERREAEAARAMTDIQRQSEAARSNADARLRSMGLDPSQMRSASLLETQGVAMAANQALAGNAARTQIEDKGRALRADALNVGMGLPAQAAMGFAGAGGSGAGALGAAGQSQAATLAAIQGGAGVAGTAMGFRSGALNNVAQLTGSPMQWAGMGGNMYGQASSSYGNAANTMNSAYQNEMSSWKAGQEQAQQSFNNIMSVASMAGGMMMAEGGAVPRRGAIHRAEGGVMSLAREKFPLATKLLVEDVDVSTSMGAPKIDRAKPREGDMYTRQGFGSGEGGALNFSDRLGNAATAGQAYQPTNVWEGQTSDLSPVVRGYTQGQPIPMAEGGAPIRARGALPVRQQRDTIPAFLGEGEYVIPEDVVRSVGLKFLDKLVQKHHRENA